MLYWLRNLYLANIRESRRQSILRSRHHRTWRLRQYYLPAPNVDNPLDSIQRKGVKGHSQPYTKVIKSDLIINLIELSWPHTGISLLHLRTLWYTF
jgi:hypothetical protein